MFEDLIYSRPEAAAKLLEDAAVDRHRFVGKRVLLTGESAVLATMNGQAVARDCLMLLIRVCANVVVWLPEDADSVASQLSDVSEALAWMPSVKFISGPEPDLSSFDAILNVGAAVRSELPWTSVNSNGWLARVSSGNLPISAVCGQFNPVGAFAAACLGVTDLFKRLIRLKSEFGELFNGLTVSLWTYEFDLQDPGPELPQSLALDLIIAGAGAIGNGTTHLIRQLPVHGRAQVIDNQTYGPENWGTCVNIGPADINRDKATTMARLLAGRLDASGQNIDIVERWKDVMKTLRVGTVILNGFDNIDARHAVQKIWPDNIIDGAIGADFSCQVSVHPWDSDTACLMCVFRKAATEPAARVQSRATGLREKRVIMADAVVTEEDVTLAPEATKGFLRKNLGRPICSVVQEAVAAHMSLETQRAGFAPSVPFVAGYSSCMIVAELIRYVTERKNLVRPRYQLNLLWGPRHGVEFPEHRHCDCLCTTRTANIEKLRQGRAA